MDVRSLVAVSALALALAACDSSDPAQTAPGGAAARGEVLGGTISDEMIPLDELRSQSPPLRPAPTGDTAAVPGDDPASDEAADDEAGEPADPADEAAAEEVAEPVAEGE